MMRRKLGYDKCFETVGVNPPAVGPLDRGANEDKEARSVKQRRSKSIRFDDGDEFEAEDKDTPPTRSRSRKARSRVAFDEPGQKSLFGAGAAGLKSTPALNLKKSDRSRGSSKSRSVPALRSVGGRSSSSNNRVFRDPSSGVGGQGTNARRDAFEAKFDKYRANKRQKELIEKRSKIFEQPDFDVTTKSKTSPSKRAKKYTTVVGAEIDLKPSGKFDKDFLMPEGYEEHLMREELLNTRKDPFRVLGVSQEDKMTFFLLKWVFDYIKQDSEVDDEELQGKAFVSKKDLVS